MREEHRYQRGVGLHGMVQAFSEQAIPLPPAALNLQKSCGLVVWSKPSCVWPMRVRVFSRHCCVVRLVHRTNVGFGEAYQDWYIWRRQSQHVQAAHALVPFTAEKWCGIYSSTRRMCDSSGGANRWEVELLLFFCKRHLNPSNKHRALERCCLHTLSSLLGPSVYPNSHGPNTNPIRSTLLE